MPIHIFEANPEQDIAQFTALLNRNREHLVTPERFEWLYLKNPHGQAKAWFVVDEKSGEKVAFTCVLPRKMKVDGKEILAWNCGDFSVDKKFRTLGVAMKLRRKAKEAVEQDRVLAFYAHPNDRMLTIHESVGHYCIGKMKRYVKLLRVDAQVNKRIKNEGFRRFARPLGNFVLRMNDLMIQNNDQEYAVACLKNESFSSEYDTLFDRVSPRYRVIGDRSSAYLNWRYTQNPLYKTDRFEIRKAGILKGYILYTLKDKVVVFKDMLCVSETNTECCLIERWIAFLRNEGFESISTIFMDQNPIRPLFESVGFKLRPDESSVYAYAKKGDAIHDIWIDGANWYMTVGDRDV